MALWKRKQKRGAAVGFLISDEAYNTLCVPGYTSLAHNPEVITAVNKIASLISSMTIHLMENGENGDVRVKDGLSAKMDINPWKYGTRKTLIHTLVRSMLLEGDGNSFALVEHTLYDGQEYIGNIKPIPPSQAAMVPDGDGYSVMIGGSEYEHENILHFLVNPDPEQPWRGTGFRVSLRDVTNNLKQAAATEKGFMESKWKPSVIVKVDALTEEFSNPEGRKRLLESYIETNQAGEPWLIPADQFQVEQVRPLSLADLALSDVVTLDKRTVASVLGVPPFLLGVGDFSVEEWNNFISSTIMPIAKGIEQELTQKVITSRGRYFRFNIRSLYAYDVTQLSQVGTSLFEHGLMVGNEVRDWVGLAPLEGLDNLLILENYIPVDKAGDQKKLIQEGGE